MTDRDAGPDPEEPEAVHADVPSSDAPSTTPPRPTGPGRRVRRGDDYPFLEG